MSSDAPDASLPAQLGEFHAELPLAGDRPNALLSLPNDRVLSLAAVLRDTPQAAPALSPEEWRKFLDLLRPHGIYALLACRLGAWPEDCRPLIGVAELPMPQQRRASGAPRGSGPTP